ncbi:copper homeostasis protein CutC [Stenotrophomonas panacihumi]|uniref:PF03932 family protein CutC n=1 Tax=Stenotrophomonas panacihumi TaxID=676599 RepID=A0A0R0AVS8_9GAMM|nr:copper homeostasis protein CutC [Stenotrophomonas panacihumi]KRG49174.1 copper homeostasis protein CutC [Stenotrophomonas panacihumi]PTN53310.1 copper homeostasis protein CutC [Stenotrophomonas panacihumi]
MSARVRLEIAAGSLASALAAQAGGADRVELCENLGEGGCTPSYGTLAVARDRLRIPLHVLIRPRGGDFLYGSEEIEVMLRDVEHCARLGCDGVVIGALEANGAVDLPTCAALREAAGGMALTFHRAIDVCNDPLVALEAAIGLGCSRVLTSGGADTALAGAPRIAAMVAHAAGRIHVMAGAGVDASNVAELLDVSHAHEVHASAGATRRSAMSYRATLAGLVPDWRQTDESRVRALCAALAQHAMRTG